MKESFQKTDPSKSSILEEALYLSRDNIYEFYDNSTKEKFHYLVSIGKSYFDSNKEKFVSMLLKGIVNTADVVEGQYGKLFSHEQKVDNLASSRENFFENLEADILIFRLILADADRDYKQKKGFSKFKSFISRDKWQKDGENKNIAINLKEDKVYHFDFGHALAYRYSVFNPGKEEDFKKLVEESISKGIEKTKNSKAYLCILLDKVNKLYNQCFIDKEHSFFNAITKRSVMTESKTLAELEMTKNLSEEDKLIFLFNEIKRRTEIVREITEKKIAS